MCTHVESWEDLGRGDRWRRYPPTISLDESVKSKQLHLKKNKMNRDEEGI